MLTQLAIQTGCPLGTWKEVPAKFEPCIQEEPLSRHIQHPPTTVLLSGVVPVLPHRVISLGTTFLRPRCQRSGRPANSTAKIVVLVPSVIMSMVLKESESIAPSRRPETHL